MGLRPRIQGVPAGLSGGLLVGEDSSVFLLPPPKTIGNAARNTLIGPSLPNFYLLLAKNTSVFVSATAQLGAKFFNFPNLDLRFTQVFDSSGR